MKLRSGRHLGSPGPPRSAAGADRISALPDDLLLLVLARLRCVRTAARASHLSRRWRGLWTRLPDLVFRDVVFPSVEPVLACVVSSALAVSLLDICIPEPERPFSVSAAETRVTVTSLLRAVALLSPEQLVLVIPECEAWSEKVELPCFQRATSISLSSSFLLGAPAAGVLFPALTTLVLSCLTDIDALVPCCPRLRVLRYTFPGGWRIGIKVHSASLRELVLEDTEQWAFLCEIDVAAPMLEQLTLSSHVGVLSVSVLAPMADNISWRCHYNKKIKGLGDWTLKTVSLLSTPVAAERRQPPVLRIDAIKKTFVYRAQDNLDLVREVEKYLQMQIAADLSVFDLELNLIPFGHGYGAVVFFFLEMHRIHTTIHRLKVAIPEYMDWNKCQEYCCCVPNDWTSQIVSLTKLEEVEIDGFQGDKHEFDFLEHLLRCALVLKRVILKQSDYVAASEVKIHDFSIAHPSVECHYVISSGSVSIAL